MSTLPLHGRVALVTGGARRTGRTIALALAAAGADLVIHYNQSAADAITSDFDAPLDGPLEVWLTFRFPMPASRSAVVKRTGWAWKDKKPDLDKLARSTCDSLTSSGLIADDARIVRLHAEKV